MIRGHIRTYFGPVIQRFIQRWRGARAESIPISQIYDRMERLLQKHGYRRSEEQTPREFAQTTASTLAVTVADSNIATTLDKVVDAFYRVRFGGRTLLDEERAGLEESLTRLEISLLDSHAK